MSTIGITTQEFGTSQTILKHPEPYSAHAESIEYSDSAAVVVDGVTILKAGTIWPANDGTAQGVVFTDVNLGTADDQHGGEAAILFEADIDLTKIPAQPSAAAISALPRITWFSATGNTPYA